MQCEYSKKYETHNHVLIHVPVMLGWSSFNGTIHMIIEADLDIYIHTHLIKLVQYSLFKSIYIYMSYIYIYTYSTYYI